MWGGSRIRTGGQRDSVQNDLVCDLIAPVAEVSAAVIAVIGTLLGSTFTYFFQSKALKRNESFRVSQELRAQRLSVYSDFAGAISEWRRSHFDWWNRIAEDPNGSATFEARVEAYRLKGLALHAFYRVQLIAGQESLVIAARKAYETARPIAKAPTADLLRARGKTSEEALEAFIKLASSDVI